MNRIIFFSVLTFCATLSNAQNAINFDGSNDNVQTNCSGVLAAANRTFEAWVYVNSSAPAANMCILDYGQNAVGSRNTFNVLTTGALSFISGGTNANISSSIGAVPDDQWTHVAFVLDNGTGYFYADGVSVGSGNLSAVNTPSGGQNVVVGQRISGGSIPFNGSIDEVRIWSVARTQAEIQAEMNNELCTGSPNLEMYLQLNQGTASGNNTGLIDVIDNSGNSISGVMNGFTLTGATSNWVTGVSLTAGMNGSSSQVSACDSYTWSANSTTYTSSGVYSEVLLNGASCDSVVILDLTINTSNDLSTNATACDSYVWGVNSQTYTQSTVVVETLTNSSGCQYDHTLNLVINNSDSGSEDITACNLYIWAADGLAYIHSGSYTATLSNVSGCDSIATLNLTIDSLDNSITENGDLTITANDANASYQWLDCDNGYALITGATSQNYTATTNGNYAVEVTNGVCTDTSACVNINYVGLSDLTNSSVKIFPNPTNGELTIQLEESSTGIFELLDMNGSLLQTTVYSSENELFINLDVKPGMYVVRLISGDEVITRKRIIKQ